MTRPVFLGGGAPAAKVLRTHADTDLVTKAFPGADCVFRLVPPDRQAGSIQAHILALIGALCEAPNRASRKARRR